MKVPVHMFAFSHNRNTVRQVEIPDALLPKSVNALIPEDLPPRIKNILDLTFKYGQNDFQPQDIYSVSVGDVVEIDGTYFMVMPMDWKQLTKEEFDSLTPPTASYAYTIERETKYQETV